MTDHTLTQSLPRKSIFAGAGIRRLLATVHLYVGLICGIPFVLLGVTGSALMLGHDLPLSSVGMAGNNPNNLGAMIEAARAAGPEGARVAAIDIPAALGEPAIVRFAAMRNGQVSLPPGPPTTPRLRIDPVTLSATAEAPQGASGFMRIMHDLHGRMLLDMPFGRSYVGWLGVFMTFLGMSGIVLWWPSPGQWRSAFTFSFGRNGLKFSRELHGAVGIWGLIVFIIVSFSGVYIAFPLTFNDAFGAGKAVRESRGPQSQAPVIVTPIEGETPLHVDGAVALARAEIADGRVRSVFLPLAPNQAYRIVLGRPGDGNNAPRALVLVDPWAKKVMEVRDPHRYSATDAFLTWQRPLHTGLGLGWVWWSLVFLSGFMPLLFVCTGLTMWLLKRRNRRRVMAA